MITFKDIEKLVKIRTRYFTVEKGNIIVFTAGKNTIAHYKDHKNIMKMTDDKINLFLYELEEGDRF